MSMEMIARSLRNLDTSENRNQTRMNSYDYVNEASVSAYQTQLVTAPAPPLDDATLVAPWFIGEKPRNEVREILRNLLSACKISEFVVRTIARPEFLLTVKVNADELESFPIDWKTAGSLQGFSVRGSQLTFPTMSDLIKYLGKYQILPVKLSQGMSPLPADFHTMFKLKQKFGGSPEKTVQHRVVNAVPSQILTVPPTIVTNAHNLKQQLSQEERATKATTNLAAAHSNTNTVDRGLTRAPTCADFVALQNRLNTELLKTDLLRTQYEASMQENSNETNSKLACFEAKLDALEKKHQLEIKTQHKQLTAEHEANILELQSQQQQLILKHEETISKIKFDQTAREENEHEEAQRKAALAQETHLSRAKDLRDDLVKERQALSDSYGTLQQEFTAAVEQAQHQHTREIEQLKIIHQQEQRKTKVQSTAQLQRVREQVAVERSRANLLSIERQRLSQQLTALSVTEEFTGFAKESLNQTSDDDPAEIWHKSVMSGTQSHNALAAQVDLLRLQEEQISRRIQLDVDTLDSAATLEATQTMRSGVNHPHTSPPTIGDDIDLDAFTN